jgi:outer membrane receptor protein involved in Fe transport
VTVSDCVLNGVTSFCPLIHRDASGSLLGPNGFVTSTFQNTGYLQTKGYDINIDYRFKLSSLGWGMVTVPEWGSVSMNFEGTYVESFINEPVSGLPATPGTPQTFNCAGLYGPTCGNPEPHWRHKMRVTWMSPWNFDVSAQWRYVGGSKLDFDESNKLLQNGYLDTADNHLPGISYIDLEGAWRVRDGLTVRAGINNLFDRDPPLADTSACAAAVCNANTYPGVYDALGRTMFVALTAKF